MPRHFLVRMLVTAVIIAGLWTPVLAQRVAVDGKTPANPKLILSIPATKDFWEGVNSSPGGKAVVAYIDKQHWLSNESRQMMDKLSDQLGFSLALSSLMTDSIRGLDFYLVEQGDRTGFVINARFANYDIPNRILDQLVAEAAASRGVSGGVAADTVVDTRDKDGRVVSLPAFEIYTAAHADVLTYSNSKSSLESALADEGRALFDSEYFSRYMSSLKQEPSIAWVFGEVADVAELIAHASPTGAGSMNMDKFKDMVLGATFNAVEDHIKLTTFRHQESMLPAERRYALAAPPPGEIPILGYFPANSALAVGTNYFDGLAVLDSVLEGIDQAEGLPVTRQQIDQQLQNTKMLLGFDLKNDLLSNLGPDLGVALSAPGASEPAAHPALLFAAGVKDHDAFNNVLTKVQGAIEQMSMPPPMPAPKTEEGKPTPSPSPTPEPVILSETSQGEDIRYVVTPKTAQAGVAPAWCLTKDNHFLLAADKSSVEASLAQGQAGTAAVMANPDFEKVTGFLDPLRNLIVLLDMKPVVDILESQKAMFTSGMTDEQKAQFEDGMEVLRSFRSAASCTSYKSNGKRSEFVFSM